MSKFWIYGGIVIFAVSAGLTVFVLQDLIRLKNTEIKGMNARIVPETVVTRSETGETAATQLKAEVSAETFRNLMDERIREMERRTDARLGKVQSVVEATLTTVNRQRLPVRDTTVPGKAWHPQETDSMVQARAIRWQDRWGAGTLLIRGDSAIKIDSTQNQLAILETRDRWRPRHLWPWNWGSRRRRVNLLIFNPSTRVDTLTNLSIIQR